MSQSIAPIVLKWFAAHGRKNLPWQQNKTPYRVWVSEIMLQQTQVTTVIPYFERFMQRFPTVQQLAEAADDEVLHLWTGLGYYTRARNLHRTAKLIMREFAGEFPDTLDELQMLPGIGRSTAGAILSIAFGRQAAILDGNVKRVLTRLLGITRWSGEKEVLAQLWETAEAFTPATKTADYAQAMMDLGATICTRSTPRCAVCPLAKRCLALANGLEKTIPVVKPKKVLPHRKVTLLLLHHDNSVLLQKRPPTGIWGGLWSLPELPGQATLKEIKSFCQRQLRVTIQAAVQQPPFRHTFSHFHLDILPAVIRVTKRPDKIMDDAQQLWYNLHASATVGLPAPIKKLLEETLHDPHDLLCEASERS